MDRSSTFVWKTARQQVKGLPACPADLTEPEYANLLFYARCHVRSDPLRDLKCSLMSYRVVENTRQLFSGTYVAGFAQAAESDGKVPYISRQGSSQTKLGFAAFPHVMR